jgi:hypothetical protein
VQQIMKDLAGKPTVVPVKHGWIDYSKTYPYRSKKADEVDARLQKAQRVAMPSGGFSLRV